MEIIDEELREAARSGNVEFLQKCVDDNKPNHYYLTLFPERLGDDIYYYHGNIFHIAAFEQQEEWIREAINLLPLELVHQLICQPIPDQYGNPLHVAAEMGNLKIVKMFLNAFTSHHLPLPIPNPPPWLMKDTLHGRTPCHLALYFEKEECGLEILRMDMESLSNMLDNSGWSLLATAIQNGQEKVATEIISSPYSFSASAEYGRSALFYMPHCSSSPETGKEICKSLLKKMPELIRKKRDTNKMSIFHIWARIGKLWPFECLLESSDIIPDIRHVFVELISATDDGGKNPLHYLPLNSISIEDAQIGKLLIDTYKHEHGEEAQSSSNISPRELQYPWLVQDNENKTPLDHAVDKGKEELAKMILAEDKNALKTCQENVLFVAIEKRFEEVLLKILEIVNEQKLTHLLTNDQKLNALHLAPKCKNAELAQFLVEEAPEFISKPNKNGVTPLELACERGATRIVKAMLEKGWEKDPSAFDEVHFAWIKACKNGHESVIQAFVDCCPIKFSDHCEDHNDTPLHHIKLRNLTRYEDFLKIQYMKDLINVKDSTGATPLHKAIENNNIFLAEALLKMDNIEYNIKNDDGKTARGILLELCKEPQPPLPNPQWAKMCKNIGFDPALETSYFQRKTDLLAVRDTLSVVAALLATITFTVGFTLPGGLNQDTGEAMIVNKAAFVVFLISDALAMCFSMVVLICLIWSMVLEPNDSLYLIDRSVGLLRLALYLTLIAFVTGVYIVISPKLFWAAIVIIVLCSLVLGVSLRRSSLYKVFKFMDNLYASVTKKIQDPMHRMELGLPLLCHHGESSNQNRTSTREGNEGALISDSGGSSYQSCTSTSFTERSS